MMQEMMGFGDGSGISWTICKQSAPHSRQITKPTPHHVMSVKLHNYLEMIQLRNWCPKTAHPQNRHKHTHNTGIHKSQHECGDYQKTRPQHRQSAYNE